MIIITLSDFNNLSEKDKKKALESLKREVGVGGIIKEWNISRSKAYNLMREFNISVNTKARRPTKNKMTDESQETKNNQYSNAQSNNKEENDNPLSSQLTVITSKNNNSKFHLHIETQASASMINETLRMFLESERLNDSNLEINMTLQEI